MTVGVILAENVIRRWAADKFPAMVQPDKTTTILDLFDSHEALRTALNAANEHAAEAERKSIIDEAQCDEMTTTAAELADKVCTLEEENAALRGHHHDAELALAQFGELMSRAEKAEARVAKLERERDEARIRSVGLEHVAVNYESGGNAASEHQLAEWTYGKKEADRLFPPAKKPNDSSK